MSDVPLPERGLLRHPVRAYGRTRRGRPLEVFGPLDRGTPLVLAAIHGNESETTVALSAAARMVAPGELRCAFVLAANPDGVLLGTRGNAEGIDLNRNFPTRDWESWTVVSHWSSETTQVVRLGTGEAAASEPEIAGLVALAERLAPPWILSLHAPIGAVLEAEPSALGDWLVERTGLRRMAKVTYRTTGVLDTWALEHGITPVTLELPRITHDAAVVQYAPVLADLLRGAVPSGAQ
jgi:protein MpaA